MNKQHITDLILYCIRSVQELSGDDYFILDSLSKPIYKLPGFDSPRGLDATQLIEEILEISAEKKYPNLFVSVNGDRALTISEIADRISTLLIRKVKPHGKRRQ